MAAQQVVVGLSWRSLQPCKQMRSPQITMRNNEYTASPAQSYQSVVPPQTLTDMSAGPSRSSTGDSGYCSSRPEDSTFDAYTRWARTLPSRSNATVPDVPWQNAMQPCCTISLDRCLEYNRALNVKFYELAESIYEAKIGRDLGWEIFECDIDSKFNQSHIQYFAGMTGDLASTYLTAFRQELQSVHKNCCQLKMVMQRPGCKEFQPARITLEEAYTKVAKARIACFMKNPVEKA